MSTHFNHCFWVFHAASVSSPSLTLIFIILCSLLPVCSIYILLVKGKLLCYAFSLVQEEACLPLCLNICLLLPQVSCSIGSVGQLGMQAPEPRSVPSLPSMPQPSELAAVGVTHFCPVLPSSPLQLQDSPQAFPVEVLLHSLEESHGEEYRMAELGARPHCPTVC